MHIKIEIFKNYDEIFDEQVFTGDVIKIGKLKSSHICLEDDSVARMHAIIEISNNDVKIIDLGSAAGVLVNNEQINKNYPLVNEDVISIGVYTLKVYFEKNSQITEKEPPPIETEKDKFEREIIKDLIEIQIDENLKNIRCTDTIFLILTQKLQLILNITPLSCYNKAFEPNSQESGTIYSIFFDFKNNEYLTIISKIKISNKIVSGTFSLFKLSNPIKFVPENIYNNVEKYFTNVPSFDNFMKINGRTIFIDGTQVTISFKNGETEISFTGNGVSIFDAYAYAYFEMKKLMLG